MSLDTILIFSLIAPWENNPRKPSTMAYADELDSSNNKILCLEPSVFSIYTFLKYPNRIFKYLRGEYKFRRVYKNIYAFCPFTIEHIYLTDKTTFFKSINTWLLKKQISAKLKKLDVSFEKIIFVLHRPELHFLGSIFNNSKIIYECQDDFLNNPNHNRFKILSNKEKETDFVKKCDLVIATSEKLFNRFIEHNKNTFLIENGYSEKIFKNEIKFKTKSDRLVAGYIGHVRDWIDMELVEFIVSNNPDVIFNFSGSLQKELKKSFKKLVDKYSNIVYIDNVFYENYPKILSEFNIGLIPFKMNEFMSCSNPNKFYEYLGVSLPVISTDIGDIKKKYSSCVMVASSKMEFNNHLHTIKKMTEEDYIFLRNKIKTMGINHTWENNAKDFKRLLSNILAVK